MRKLLVVLVAALLTAAPGVCQQESPDREIHDMVETYVRAFNAGDADAAAATYTPAGSHTYAMGFTHHGRTEIARGLREMFAGPLKGAQIAIESLVITPLAPTVAVEEERFTLHGLTSPEGQTLPEIHGLCLVVYQNWEGQWLAAAVQCMVPPPPAETR